MRGRGTWSWLGALLLLGGCGGDGGAQAEAGAGGDVSVGAEAPEAVPKGPVEPLTLLPPDSLAVGRADIERLRGTPYADVLTQWLAIASERAGADAASKRLHREVLDATEVAYAAAAPAPEGQREPDVVVVLRGQYPDGLLERWLQSETGQAQLDSEQVGEQRVYVTPEGRATQLEDHTWILAVQARFGPTLERAVDRSGVSPLDSAPLGPMAERVGFAEATAAAVAEPTEEMLAMAGRRAPIDPRLLEGVELVGARLDADDRVEGRAIARTVDEASAQALAQWVEGSRRRFGSNMFVRMLGFDALFDGASASADGSTAQASLSLTRADAEDLLAKLERLAEMIRGGGDGGIRFQIGGGTSAKP